MASFSRSPLDDFRSGFNQHVDDYIDAPPNCGGYGQAYGCTCTLCTAGACNTGMFDPASCGTFPQQFPQQQGAFGGGGYRPFGHHRGRGRGKRGGPNQATPWLYGGDSAWNQENEFQVPFGRRSRMNRSRSQSLPRPWMNAFLSNQGGLSSRSQMPIPPHFGLGTGWDAMNYGGVNSPSEAIRFNIVKELLQDLRRNDFQAELVKTLLKKSKATRNRVGLVKALKRGEQIPPYVISKLLAEDWMLDSVTEGMVGQIVDDRLMNRHSDAIIDDCLSGRPHLPHPFHQSAVERENFLFDSLAAKGVQRLTSPHARRAFAQPAAVHQMLETLAAGPPVGIAPGSIF
ncbi:hypothetical protein HDU81_008618 [Chytriomyces hyalinus]|nr:hypothetical protein HDU81_008618 [Chytriomyces hyalinus]